MQIKSLQTALATIGLLTLGGALPLPWSSFVNPVATSTQGASLAYNLASLEGRHGFSYEGTSRVFGTVASCGRIDFDGEGGLRAEYTTVLGGRPFHGTFVGTYTVDANGTGSVALELPFWSAQLHGDFVLVDRGDATYFTSTDTGYSIIGRTHRM
jgi:hypothetical protein